MILGGTSSKSVVATRVPTPPRIDGILADSQWQAAVPASGFEQFDPNEGAPSTEQSTVRVLYDDNSLYVGVMCYDADPAGIVKQLTRRDRPGQTDKFSVIIDSYHDHSTAFLFSGTVSGVQADGILSQDGRAYDVQWDAVWEYDARVTPEGWSAEFKIPFSALRFSGEDREYIWGVNFRRYIARKNETDEWVMVPRKETPIGVISIVSKIGHLSGIKDIHPPLHLEVLPYQVTKANYLSQPDPYPLRKELKGTGGLDLKYGVTNNFTLDMAINPDFGQVEVDQAILNLSVFETFYPEKRPFFLEGSQLFSFGNVFDNQQLRIFYPRRIGKKPVGQADPGYLLTESPQLTTILGAGKFTGKTDNGLSLGVLSAATDNEEGVQQDSAGHAKSLLFEPRASYNVVRLRQDVLENSFVGMIATGTFKDQSFHPAFSGGFDWNLRGDGGDYGVDGYLALSHSVSPLAYPDANPVTGGAGKIGLGKLADEHWLAFSLYDFSTRNFWIDDLGFYSQPREQGGYSEISYKEDHALAPVRRYVLDANSTYRWNWDGINTLDRLELDASWEFRNFWSAIISYDRDFPAYDDLYRGMVGLYHRPSGNSITTTVQSDARQQVSFLLNTGYRSFSKGAQTILSTLELTYRPSSVLEFNPAITLARTRSEEAWPVYFYTDGGSNLFGDRDIDEYDISLRGIVTFTRTTSLQFFTQVLLAKGSYVNFKRLLPSDPDLLPTYDYQHSAASASQGSPDFNEKTLNANVVFRWEYLPGSTIYFVWTQARFGNTDVLNKRFSDNFSETFRLPMDNVILAKISYWWSL